MRTMPSLFLLFLFCLLFSCSLQSRLTLNSDGSAQIDAAFSLSAQAKEAWSHLRDLDPTLPADPFDPQLLGRGLGPTAHVTTTTSGTSVGFSVSDPKKLFPELKLDTDTWELAIDRTTVRRLAGLTSWADSPAIDSLVPSPQTKVTQAEYRDLLAYLLGPGTTEAAARKLIDASTVELTVEAPRPLRSAEGSVSFTGRTALYRWPLIRVLTLETPIRLSLKF